MAQSKPLVYIVDDDLAAAQMLAYILEADYHTAIAGSGREAMQLIRREQPDLVLLDVQMPGKGGLDICDELKRKPTTARIPIIFVTGMQDHASQTRGFQVGASDYITKPIIPALVKARVARTLEVKLYVDFLESLLASRNQTIESMQQRVHTMLNPARAVA